MKDGTIHKLKLTKLLVTVSSNQADVLRKSKFLVVDDTNVADSRRESHLRKDRSGLACGVNIHQLPTATQPYKLGLGSVYWGQVFQGGNFGSLQ